MQAALRARKLLEDCLDGQHSSLETTQEPALLIVKPLLRAGMTSDNQAWHRHLFDQAGVARNLDTGTSGKAGGCARCANFASKPRSHCFIDAADAHCTSGQYCGSTSHGASYEVGGLRCAGQAVGATDAVECRRAATCGPLPIDFTHDPVTLHKHTFISASAVPVKGHATRLRSVRNAVPNDRPTLSEAGTIVSHLASCAAVLERSVQESSTTRAYHSSWRLVE